MDALAMGLPVTVTVGVILLVTGASALVLHCLTAGPAPRLRRRIEEASRRRGGEPTTKGERIRRGLRRASGFAALFGPRHRREIAHTLALAGFRSDDAAVLVYAGKLAGLVLAAAASLVVGTTEPLPVPAPVFWCGAVAVAVSAGTVAELIVGELARRRQRALLLALPDVIDLMTVCTAAGFSLDRTVGRVSRDVRGFAPEMADELRRLSDEMAILPDRLRALENFAGRSELKGIRSLVAALTQASRLGTPVNAALRTVAEEARRELIADLEEWAAKVPVRMTFPIVLLILPAVLLIVGGPAYVNLTRVL